MTPKEKIQSLITAANATTGESAADLTEAVQDLVDGYGSCGFLRETGTISFHTGARKQSVQIPVSDISYANYLLVMKATKSWGLVDGVWTERSSVDMTGLNSSDNAMIYLTCVYPQPLFAWVDADGNARSAQLRLYDPYIKNTAYSGIQGGNADSGLMSVDSSGLLKIPHSLQPVCGTAYGMTYEYEIVGWNNA